MRHRRASGRKSDLKYRSAVKEISMRITRYLAVTTVAALLIVGSARLSPLPGTTSQVVHASTSTPNPGVAPQYDTTHVYVAPEDFDRFVASLIATFGGTTTKQGVFTVTPTPSSTMSQLVLTPAGSISVFGFKTPIPYPFGSERTGYLVTDQDIGACRTRGSHRAVEVGHQISRSTIRS